MSLNPQLFWRDDGTQGNQIIYSGDSILSAVIHIYDVSGSVYNIELPSAFHTVCSPRYGFLPNLLQLTTLSPYILNIIVWFIPQQSAIYRSSCDPFWH